MCNNKPACPSYEKESDTTLGNKIFLPQLILSAIQTGKGGNAGEHKWNSAVGIGEFIYCGFFLMFLQMNLKRIMIKWCRLVQSKKNQAKKNGWKKSKSSAPDTSHGLLCFVSKKQWNCKLAFSRDKYSTLCYVLRLT